MDTIKAVVLSPIDCTAEIQNLEKGNWDAYNTIIGCDAFYYTTRKIGGATFSIYCDPYPSHASQIVYSIFYPNLPLGAYAVAGKIIITGYDPYEEEVGLTDEELDILNTHLCLTKQDTADNPVLTLLGDETDYSDTIKETALFEEAIAKDREERRQSNEK